MVVDEIVDLSHKPSVWEDVGSAVQKEMRFEVHTQEYIFLHWSEMATKQYRDHSTAALNNFAEFTSSVSNAFDLLLPFVLTGFATLV